MTKRCFDNKWEDEWLQGSRVVQATLVGNNNPAQEQGSALTYARRYSLLMAFGLATEDDDANLLNKTKDQINKFKLNINIEKDLQLVGLFYCIKFMKSYSFVDILLNCAKKSLLSSIK